LANAIRSAREGKSIVSADIQNLLRSGSSSKLSGQKDKYNLSAREREVLACMVSGLSNADIAQQLVISLSTAKYHVSSILTKLGASSRAEAVVIALQERLIEVPARLKKT
ncbi:MAG: response regulator transcription factor, partial [Chloroflexota bacterium]